MDLERLPGWILAVLPSFKKTVILFSPCAMTQEYACQQLRPLSCLSNRINENLGNTASIQPGNLFVEIADSDT